MWKSSSKIWQILMLQKNHSSSRGFDVNSQTWNWVVIRYFIEKVMKTTKWYYQADGHHYFLKELHVDIGHLGYDLT